MNDANKHPISSEIQRSYDQALEAATAGGRILPRRLVSNVAAEALKPSHVSIHLAGLDDPTRHLPLKSLRARLFRRAVPRWGSTQLKTRPQDQT